MKYMGVAAVGAYVRTLADLQRITYAEATEEAGVQPKYIWRLENEAIKESSARVLRLLTKAVHGSWEDVGELIADVKATPQNGRAKALAWATQSGMITPTDRVVIEQATPDELDQAAEELRRRAAKLRGS